MNNNEKLKQAEENLKKLLNSDPILKKAFIETIEEMRKPENIKEMAEKISGVIKETNTIRECLKAKESDVNATSKC